MLILIHPLVTLARLLAHFSLDFSQFYNLWQLIWLCLAALINCRLTWQLNSSPLPLSLSVDCTPKWSHDYRLRNVAVVIRGWVLSLANNQTNWPFSYLSQGNCNLPTKQPSDQATKRPPSHTDNDRVIALNPSIKRGHHDIVAPPAAKLPRLLPLLPKKKKRSQNWRRSLSTTSTTTFKFANCQVRSGNCNGATVAK